MDALPVKILKTTFKWLVRLENLVLSLLLLAMILLAATQITLRNLFDTGLYWADPLLRIMVLWLAMLGAMVATRDRHHIHIDILTRYFHDRGKTVSQAITDSFSGIICSVLAWHAGRFVYFEWQDGNRRQFIK